MKKIIDGKMFNTETAQKVAKYGHRYEVILYRKDGVDEYFLHTISVNDGKKSIDIESIDIEAAKTFCECNATAEVYESLFGEVIE